MKDEKKQPSSARTWPAFMARSHPEVMVYPGLGLDVRPATAAELDGAIALWRHEADTLTETIAQSARGLLHLGAEVVPEIFLRPGDEARDYPAAVGALAIAEEIVDHLVHAEIDAGVFRRFGRMVSWFRSLAEQGGVLGFAGNVATIVIEGFDLDDETRLFLLAAVTLEDLGLPIVRARLAQIGRREVRADDAHGQTAAPSATTHHDDETRDANVQDAEDGMESARRLWSFMMTARGRNHSGSPGGDFLDDERVCEGAARLILDASTEIEETTRALGLLQVARDRRLLVGDESPRDEVLRFAQTIEHFNDIVREGRLPSMFAARVGLLVVKMTNEESEREELIEELADESWNILGAEVVRRRVAQYERLGLMPASKGPSAPVARDVPLAPYNSIAVSRMREAMRS